MYLTESIRHLKANMDGAETAFTDAQDPRFTSIFQLLDKDGSGSLDKDEVFTFVKLLELEKSKSAGLKKNLMAVVGISVCIIALLVAAMFGAVFVAVNATKDTAVSSSGALMTKDGSRQLSTIAQGTQFQLFNTSENVPICIPFETYDSFKSRILGGLQVVLDVEEEGLTEHTIITLDTATKIAENATHTQGCFSTTHGNVTWCFERAPPGMCEAENSFGLRGRRLLTKTPLMGSTSTYA